jgi:eukaryotic-like serine/threonine-protein kinase
MVIGLAIRPSHFLHLVQAGKYNRFVVQESISYIFASYYCSMERNLRKIVTSERAKKIYITLAFLAVLFVVCNDFILPWYVNQGGLLEVPSVIGLKIDDAIRMVDSVGLEGRKGDTRVDREHPAGIVIIQNPLPRSKVKKGRRVYLTVSETEPSVKVPNIKGRTIRDATFALEREGLKLGAVEYQPSAEFPPNTVIEQKLLPGAQVKRDVYVSIIVSQGKTAEQVTVPDLNGKSLGEAGKILANCGLKVGNITYLPSANVLPNTVVDQFPRIGESVPYGQSVDLFVVQGGEKKKKNFEN